MIESCTNSYKEVFFYKYCPKCKYDDCLESNEPCSTCLDNPVNEFSHKPINFKEKK